MKSTNINTIDLGEAIYFVSITSSEEAPVFSVSLGYNASDGDTWELSRDQLLDLKTLIEDHLKAEGIPEEGKYSNQYSYYEDAEVVEETADYNSVPNGNEPCVHGIRGEQCPQAPGGVQFSTIYDPINGG